jgi:hypothetical protein
VASAVLTEVSHNSSQFLLANPPTRAKALESTQSLTEMNTRNLPGGKGRPALKG